MPLSQPVGSNTPVPTDDDPFPLNPHKGKPYGSVPAKYLDWLRGQPWRANHPEVMAYIKANEKYIDLELDKEDQ